ncbi:MAG TPA: hypothetical protein PLK15_05935 [Chitinophagales bacterium]|jgi:hypothetical protein|nr:hypothetical protein [Chitinophagales bacterium]
MKTVELKQEIHNTIVSIENEEILNAIYIILKKHHSNAYVEQYNKDIDASMEQYNAGNYKTQENFKNLKS